MWCNKSEHRRVLQIFSPIFLRVLSAKQCELLKSFRKLFRSMLTYEDKGEIQIRSHNCEQIIYYSNNFIVLKIIVFYSLQEVTEYFPVKKLNRISSWFNKRTQQTINLKSQDKSLLIFC